MSLNHIPDEGEIVFAPSFHARGYTKITGGANAEHDKRLFEQGLLFSTTEDAKEETNRIYSILSREQEGGFSSKYSDSDEDDLLSSEIKFEESKIVFERESINTNEIDNIPISAIPREHIVLVSPDYGDVVLTGDSSEEELDQKTESDDSVDYIEDSAEFLEKSFEEQPSNVVSKESFSENTDCFEENFDDIIEDVLSSEETSPPENSIIEEDFAQRDVESSADDLHNSCLDLFNVKDDFFLHSTPFSASVRVSCGVLVDRIESAREQFIESISRDYSRDDCMKIFVKLVENIPKDSRAKILFVMGSQQFALMLTNFYLSSVKGL